MRIVDKLLVSVVLGLMPVSGMAFKIEGNRVEQVKFGTIRVDERECSPDLLLPVLTKEVTYVDSARMRQDQAEVQSMIGQMGKKFENPFQRDMVERAMKYMQRTDNKYYAKVRSDYEKGIISKKLKEYLSDLADDYSNILGALGGNERLRSIGNNLRSRGLVNAADYYATRTDTLINPCVRSGYGDAGGIDKYADWIISTRLDNLYAVKDWKWVFSEKAEPVLEGFPARVSWLRYKSHPQYRIIPIQLTIGFYGENFTENVADFGRYCESILAFDSYGNLTHVIWSQLPSPYKTGRQHYLARQIYAQAYRANDYNIHSYGKATEHYIKVQIGLEELTAKEKADMAALRKQSDDAAQARDKARALYGRRSTQARQAESRANRLSEAVLSLNLNNGVPYDSDGRRWLDAIEDLWIKNFFAPSCHIEVMERTGDRSFCKIYFNKHRQPVCRIDYDFYSNGAYDVNIRQTFTRLCGDPDAVKEIIPYDERWDFNKKDRLLMEATNEWLRTK